MAYLGTASRRSPQEPIALDTNPDSVEPATHPLWSKLENQLPLFIAAGMMLTWEIWAYMGWVSALFFPAPTTIAQTFIEQLLNGELLEDLFTTLSRLVLGLLFGGSTGLLLGLFMGWSPRIRSLIDPFVAALHPVPKISVLPLVMIIFGIGEASKIALIAVSTFFPMLINTMAGVRQIAPIHFEAAKNYGARNYKLLTRVILPGSLPLILTGARLALNTALVITIAVELLTAQEGLGATIWLAWETLRTENLYVALVVTALLGSGFNYVLQWCERKFIRYQ